MIGTLLKVFAYSKAPRTTFTMLHPTKAVLFRKFQWDMRHAYAPRVTALGAAALALPVGLWLGRRSRSRDARSVTEIGWRGVWRADLSDIGPLAGNRDADAGRHRPAGQERTSTADPDLAQRDAARMQTDADGMSSANAMGPMGTRRMHRAFLDETGD
jgi:hypothetical protein